MRRSFGRMIAFCGILALAIACGVWAQPATENFEVAAIRPNPNGTDKTDFRVSDGKLTVTSASLKTLVRTVYEVLDSQIVGGPAWFDNERFDIQAQTSAPIELTYDRIKPLLRNLLADRFQLKVHRESREMSVYALVLDKGGPKFNLSTRTQGIGMNTRQGAGTARMTGTKVPMALLATKLGDQLGRAVIDKTGLQGDFDFTFEWDPEQGVDSSSPSLFTALREQLGLRLESQRGPVEMLVIDSAEKPSEN